MSFHVADAWRSVIESPAFAIALTLAAYQLGRWLWARTKQNPLLNPVLVAIVIIGSFLAVADVDYETYMSGGSVIALLLGPAVVALAIPLHREIVLVKQASLAILGSVLIGSVAAIVTAYVLTDLAGGSEELAVAMSPKSVSSPIAIALAGEIGGLPALTAVLAITAGILGAVAGPFVLRLVGIKDKRARGLGVGLASHGIGTARVLHDDLTVGAFAGLAMALNGLATAAVLPLLLDVLR
jgi:predicted murein hydrolase (TIGR00659 family)